MTSEPAPPSATRDRGTRAYLVAVTVLCLAGFLGAYVVSGRRSDAEVWASQLRSDTDSWMQFLRPDPRLMTAPEHVPEFLDAWEQRRALYDAEHAARLRDGLHAYLDFLEAEYADAADIWDSGEDHVLSARARSARAALDEHLPAFAATLIEQSDTDVREAAFRSSPKTLPDPDTPNFRKVFEDVAAWVREAHGIVDLHVTAGQ